MAAATTIPCPKHRVPHLHTRTRTPSHFHPRTIANHPQIGTATAPSPLISVHVIRASAWQPARRPPRMNQSTLLGDRSGDHSQPQIVSGNGLCVGFLATARIQASGQLPSSNTRVRYANLVSYGCGDNNTMPKTQSFKWFHTSTLERPHISTQEPLPTTPKSAQQPHQVS